MTLVWDSDAYQGGTLLVLLAMADWAQDDGTRVHPHMETLAKKARLSVRGAQRCVLELKKDGVIIEVVPARRGRATEYKIMLDRVKELHRNNCTAITSGEKSGTNGVTSDPVGVTSAASHIDNHQEPSDEPSYASARERWSPVWAAFKTWPGLSAGASEQRARQAWERMQGRLPVDLLERIRAHGEALTAENERRGARAGQSLPVHPHNWLERDRGWLGYGGRADPEIAIPDCWGDMGKAMVAAIGAAKFQSWFGDALVDLGPPARIGVKRPFAKDYIAANFAKPLQQVFGGEVILEVAA
jgi:hypothetical protein